MEIFRYRARNRCRKWGYIDDSGSVAIDFLFDSAFHFSEGMASVELDGKKAVIDAKGEIQFFHNYCDIGWFRAGLAWCKDEQGNTGFLDVKGKLVIPPVYSGASDFQSGVSIVIKGKKFGVLDTNGKERIPCKLDFCHRFCSQSANATFKVDKKWGLISKNGDILCEPRWEYAHMFSEGVVPVRIDGLWGLCNENGQVIIEPKFAETNFYMSEGRLGVTDGKAWRFIDVAGRSIGSRSYTYADPFSSGMSKVYVGGRYDKWDDTILEGGSWGFADLDGILRIPARYDDCEAFDGPLTAVYVGDPEAENYLGAYIDRKGTVVWKP